MGHPPVAVRFTHFLIHKYTLLNISFQGTAYETFHCVPYEKYCVYPQECQKPNDTPILQVVQYREMHHTGGESEARFHLRQLRHIPKESREKTSRGMNEGLMRVE